MLPLHYPIFRNFFLQLLQFCSLPASILIILHITNIIFYFFIIVDMQFDSAYQLTYISKATKYINNGCMQIDDQLEQYARIWEQYILQMNFLSTKSSVLMQSIYPCIYTMSNHRVMGYLSFYMSPNKLYYAPRLINSSALIQLFTEESAAVTNPLLLGLTPFVNAEHTIAKCMLAANFKNHLMNYHQAEVFFKDIRRIVKLRKIDVVEQMLHCKLEAINEYSEDQSQGRKNKFNLYSEIKLTSEKRSNFFVYFDQEYSLQLENRIYKMDLLRLQNSNKILIFASNSALSQLSQQMTAFCHSNNIKIKILDPLTTPSATKFILDNYKGNLLIHESVDDDGTIFKQTKNKKKYSKDTRQEDQQIQQEKIQDESLIEKQAKKQKKKEERTTKPSKDQPQDLNRKDRSKASKQKPAVQNYLGADLHYMPREIIVMRQRLPNNSLATAANEELIAQKIKALMIMPIDPQISLFPSWRFAYSDITKQYQMLNDDDQKPETNNGFSTRRMIPKEWRNKNQEAAQYMIMQGMKKNKIDIPQF